jgi:Skp family chaperone for outer membrane proteins
MTTNMRTPAFKQIPWHTWIAVAAAVISVLSALYVTGGRHVGGATIAFVDFPAIMRESDAGKSIDAQAAPKQQALQAESQAKLKDFQEQDAELSKRRSSLSAAEFDEKAKALQGKINEWNAYIQQRQTALNDAVTTAVRTLQAALRDELARIATKSNFATVLPAEQAFFAPRKLDVTSEAIRRLNDRLPKVELQLERGNAPAERK